MTINNDNDNNNNNNDNNNNNSNNNSNNNDNSNKNNDNDDYIIIIMMIIVITQFHPLFCFLCIFVQEFYTHIWMRFRDGTPIMYKNVEFASTKKVFLSVHKSRKLPFPNL